MRWGWVWGLVLLGESARAAAPGKIIDLTNGVSFPSNNSALFENAAAMAVYAKRSVELAAFFNGREVPTTGTISYVGKLTGNTQFGLGTWKRSPMFDSLTVGLGQKLGQILAVGLAGTIPLQSGPINIDFGTHVNVGKKVQVGLVFRTLRPVPESWSVGFAGMLGGVIPEVDFNFFNRFNSFTPHTITVLAGVSFLVRNWVQVRFGYPFTAFPAFDFRSQLEVGLSAHLGQHVAAFFVLNDRRGIPYFMGIKIF